MSAHGKFATPALAAVVWGLGSPALLAASPLPTDQEMQTLVEGKHFDLALPLLERVVRTKKDVAKDNDRFTDLMLKLECLLQLHKADVLIKRTVVDAFAEAHAQHDSSKLAEVALFDLIYSDSKMGKYVPRLGDNKQPFNLYDPSERKAAAPFLYADGLSGLQIEWKDAKAAESLAPVANLAGRFGEVQALENSVNGNTNNTSQLGVEISQFAAKMADDMLTTDAERITELQNSAREKVPHKVIPMQGRPFIQQIPRGLSDNDITQLRKLQKDCKKMSDDIAKIDAGMAEPLPLGSNVPTAMQVSQKAHNLLHEFNQD